MNEGEQNIVNTPVLVQPQKANLLQSASDKQRKIIITTGIVVGISALGLLAAHLLIKKGKKVISKIEEGRVFSGDQHAAWAKRFKVAFLNDGWAGTIETVVRNTLLEIPSKEDFKKVENSYSKMFEGEVLGKTLESELSHTEYAEMVAIFNSKPEKSKNVQKGVPIFDPEGWAIRIHAGVSYQWLSIGWGTDWEAIKRVIIEMKKAGAQKSFKATELEYEDKFATSLKNDLQGDLDLDQLKWVARTLNG